MSLFIYTYAHTCTHTDASISIWEGGVPNRGRVIIKRGNGINAIHKHEIWKRELILKKQDENLLKFEYYKIDIVKELSKL